MTDQEFMQEAIALSAKGINEDHGGPFGCIVVKENKIVGRGWNQVLATNDPTAHAEVIAIRDACHNLGSYQLNGCTIYTSCEPCPMCMGAIYWSRPDKVFYANTRSDAAEIGFDDSMIYEELVLAIEKRRIPMMPMGRDEAIKIFTQWVEKGDKRLR